MSRGPGKALLLDLGGTVGLSPLELMGVYAEREPAAREVLARRGPLGGAHDELWDRVLSQEITEAEYLARRAGEVGQALGRDVRVREFMRELYTMPGTVTMRPEAASLLADVRAAGIPVGALTNDLASLGPPAARRAQPHLVPGRSGRDRGRLGHRRSQTRPARVSDGGRAARPSTGRDRVS
jgi:hypothetical protein